MGNLHADYFLKTFWVEWDFLIPCFVTHLSAQLQVWVLQTRVALALEEQEFESEFSFQYNVHDLSSWGIKGPLPLNALIYTERK